MRLVVEVGAESGEEGTAAATRGRMLSVAKITVEAGRMTTAATPGRSRESRKRRLETGRKQRRIKEKTRIDLVQEGRRIERRMRIRRRQKMTPSPPLTHLRKLTTGDEK